MRNNRFSVALHDERDVFIRYISSGEASSRIDRQNSHVLLVVSGVNSYGCKVPLVRAISLNRPGPPPQPSTSAISPCPITYSDMMANVGLPAGIHDLDILPGRMAAARDKIAEFETPAWADMIVKRQPEAVPRWLDCVAFCAG